MEQFGKSVMKLRWYEKISMKLKNIKKILINKMSQNIFKSLKSMAKNANDAVRKKIRSFSDWILGHVPEPIKKPINEKIEALKQLVFDFYKKGHSQSFKIRE